MKYTVVNLIGQAEINFKFLEMQTTVSVNIFYRQYNNVLPHNVRLKRPHFKMNSKH